MKGDRTDKIMLSIIRGLKRIAKDMPSDFSDRIDELDKVRCERNEKDAAHRKEMVKK